MKVDHALVLHELVLNYDGPVLVLAVLPSGRNLRCAANVQVELPVAMVAANAHEPQEPIVQVPLPARNGRPPDRSCLLQGSQPISRRSPQPWTTWRLHRRQRGSPPLPPCVGRGDGADNRPEHFNTTTQGALTRPPSRARPDGSRHGSESITDAHPAPAGRTSNGPRPRATRSAPRHRHCCTAWDRQPPTASTDTRPRSHTLLPERRNIQRRIAGATLPSLLSTTPVGTFDKPSSRFHGGSVTATHGGPEAALARPTGHRHYQGGTAGTDASCVAFRGRGLAQLDIIRGLRGEVRDGRLRVRFRLGRGQRAREGRLVQRVRAITARREARRERRLGAALGRL